MGTPFDSAPDFKNPADAGMKYLDQIPGQVSPYFNPYINQGKDAGNKLQGQYGQMTDDPGALWSKLGAGYKQSPGYQFKLNQALMAGNNAAAAGGMAGSNQHQQTQMQTANDISSQDFNDYMGRVLGLYNSGIEGEQGFQKQGFEAGTDLGTTIGNLYNSKADLAAQGVNQENQYNQAKAKANADMWGNLAGTAAEAFIG